MTRNAGKVAEGRIMQMLEEKGNVSFRKYSGKLENIDTSGEVLYTPGHGTRCKFDVRIGDYRLQIKSSTGHSATVFCTTIENLLNCAEREMFDASPLIDAYNELVSNNSVKKVKLSDICEQSDLEDVIRYFLFEGTPKSQEIPSMQANYLLFVSADDMVLCNKQEAIELLWSKLYVEIKPRNDKRHLSVRVGK